MTTEMGSRPPAPDPLRLVQDFVNTRDLEEGTDTIADATGLGAWLAEQGLPGSGRPLTADDVAAAAQLREGLRGLLCANAGAELRPAAVAAVNGAAERSALRMRLDAHGAASLDAADGAAGIAPALGRILAAMYAATADGTWGRLKACRADDCEWAFYDRSKNRSGQWCEMAVCGCRHKVRAFRARRGRSGADELLHTPSAPG